MRSGLGTLVAKEVKELLRDPKILLGITLMPLLVFPIMGLAVRASMASVERATRSVSVAVLDLDNQAMAQNLTDFLKAYPNLTIVEVNASNETEALQGLQENVTALLVIPAGFSYNITHGSRANLDVYAVLKGVSITETGRSAVAENPLSVYKEILVLQTVQSLLENSTLRGRDPGTVLDPIGLSYSTVIRGAVIKASPNALFGVVMSQSMMLPMVILMMLIFAMQIAATSIAMEKEEKTLETLLTLPVGRLTILTGKLAGSVVVAAASAIAYIVGFGYYMGSALGGAAPTIDLKALGLAPSPVAYLLLGVTMFVTVVSALALAISIAVFTDNVRSAQSLLGFIIMPIIIPSIVLMFADINILPVGLQVVLYAIPYTHTILATKAVFTGNLSPVLLSIAYISLFTVAVLYLAARIFTTEKVITARISMRRLRLRK